MCVKAKISNQERERAGQKLLSRKEVMRLHGEYWEGLATDKKQGYEDKAHALRGEREAELRERIDEQVSAVQRALSEVEQEKASRSDSMMFWPCRFSADQIAKLQCLIEGDSLSNKVVKELSAKSASCPQPLSEEHFQTLMRAAPIPVPPPTSSPALALVVARGRLSLQAAVIAVEEGETTSWYRFLAALLNPARVLLQPLRLVDIPVQPKIGITKHEWEQLQQSDHTHMWSPASGAAVPHWLEAVFSGHQAGRSQASASSAIPTDVSRCAHRAAASSAPEIGGSGASDSESTGDSLSDGAEAELLQQRQELAESKDLMNLHFRVAILGGTWQVQRTGRAIYGLRCDIKPTSPLHDWAPRVGLNKSASFEYNVYGEQAASHLAGVWRERLLFLHRLCEEQTGTPDLQSTPFEVPSELQTCLDALRGRAQKRYLQILQMKPRSWGSA